jgi:hypothetical protein
MMQRSYLQLVLRLPWVTMMEVKMTRSASTGGSEFPDEFGGREPPDAPDEFGGRQPG